MSVKTQAEVVVKKIEIHESLDIDAYTHLRNLGNKSPKELRGMAFSSAPKGENLQRWDRGELIAYVFDKWLQKRAMETPTNSVGVVSFH